MKVKNDTKDTVLAEDAALRVSSLGKALGLRFRRNPKPLAFLFRIPRRVSLDMFFVFFPIDVLFLDEKKEIVEIKEGFQPFETYKPEEKARFVIELPENTVGKTGTELGDEVSFEDLRKNI